MERRPRTRLQKIDTVSGRTAGTGGMVWFALPFLGLGGFLALAGFGVIPLPGKANAPLPVIGCVGVAFFLAGTLVLSSGLRGILHRGRRRRLEELYGAEPWTADYPWDPTGTFDRSLGRVFQSWLFVVFLGFFLAPFHWWAWASDEGGLFVRGIVVFFSLIHLCVLGTALRRTAQWLRYGRTRLRYDDFPFHPGETVRVTYAPNRFATLKGTVRCVEEYWETTGTGKHRRKSLVVDSLWSEAHEWTPHRQDVEVALRFDLPDDEQLVNRLSRAPVRYWELVLEAEAAGVDFHATYLLPVYASRLSRPRSSTQVDAMQVE